MDQAVGEGSEARIVDPDLSTAGIVEFLWQPDDGFVEGGGEGATMFLFQPLGLFFGDGHIAEEAILLDERNFPGGHPGSLIIGDGELIVVEFAHTVGGAETPGDDIGATTFGWNAHDGAGSMVLGVLSGFGEIEVAG